jgi:hypothetical protein
MPQGHKSGRKTIMTRLMPLRHNPSTRLMPQGYKVNVYGKFYIEIHRIVSIGPIDGKFNHFPPN